MPEGYTHVRTARKAAETIHYKIQCPAAFAAGANGPDSFFCFEIWKKRAKRRYDLPGLGSRMHEEKTGAFLRSLCANVKTRPQVEYTLGFLSHYAADTVGSEKFTHFQSSSVKFTVSSAPDPDRPYADGHMLLG